MDTDLILSLVVAGLVVYALISLGNLGLRYLAARSKKVANVVQAIEQPKVQPKKWYIRTFIYADGHTITRKADGEELMTRLTDAYGSSLYDKADLVEVRDGKL